MVLFPERRNRTITFSQNAGKISASTKDDEGPLMEADACYLKSTIKTSYFPIDCFLEKCGSLEEATTEFRGEQ
jgi:hypothetical protein